MVAKDLHKEPFSEETITKLDIFEKYLQSWLPVAIKSRYIREINICDFFAGTGKDIKGVEGSSLRIIRNVKKYENEILKQKLKIKLLFNEHLQSKYRQLFECIEKERVALRHLNGLLAIKLFNQDFKEVFDSKQRILKQDFNLIFLDQSGVKHITEEVFLSLVSFQRTDFMFFISSSSFKRFANDLSFQKYFPDIDIQAIYKTKQTEMHRLILKYYRSKIPLRSKLKLYPFTIKKGRNVYGLIFGSNHPLGVEKFLRIAWETNELNGEANFDIDSDYQTKQMILFGKRRLSKIEKFQYDLEELILSKDKISNVEIYFFTLECGHITPHSLKVVKELKANGKIMFSGYPNISYNKCCKDIQLKYFKVIK